MILLGDKTIRYCNNLSSSYSLGLCCCVHGGQLRVRVGLPAQPDDVDKVTNQVPNRSSADQVACILVVSAVAATHRASRTSVCVWVVLIDDINGAREDECNVEHQHRRHEVEVHDCLGKRSNVPEHGDPQGGGSDDANELQKNAPPEFTVILRAILQGPCADRWKACEIPKRYQVRAISRGVASLLDLCSASNVYDPKPPLQEQQNWPCIERDREIIHAEVRPLRANEAMLIYMVNNLLLTLWLCLRITHEI